MPTHVPASQNTVSGMGPGWGSLEATPFTGSRSGGVDSILSIPVWGWGVLVSTGARIPSVPAGAGLGGIADAEGERKATTLSLQ